MRHKLAALAQVMRNMVGVAQLVEHRIVTPVVVGSIPIVHPIFEKAPDLSSGAFALSALHAEVVELVDTLDLGSSVARRESSSLSFRTNSGFAGRHRLL